MPVIYMGNIQKSGCLVTTLYHLVHAIRGFNIISI